MKTGGSGATAGFVAFVTLAVTMLVLAIGVAAYTFLAEVAGSARPSITSNSASSATSHPAASRPVSTAPTPEAETPTDVVETTPSWTFSPSPLSTFQAPAQLPVESAGPDLPPMPIDEATLNAEPDVPPVASEPACPSGAVTVGLSSVTFSDDQTYNGIMNVVTVTGQGTVRNASTSPATFSIISIPNVIGLDRDGRTVLSNNLGDFDYTPPAGQPRPDEVVLTPGESLNFSFTNKDERAETVADVTHWYIDLDYWTSYAVTPEGTNYLCEIPVKVTEDGQSLPSTYRRR